MKPLPELYDEHFEREAEKWCEQYLKTKSCDFEKRVFTAGANSLKGMILDLVEALEFYSIGNNFENGVIVSSDIEPAEKIVGKSVYHYSDPPKHYNAWIGGKKSREALQKLRKELGE